MRLLGEQALSRRVVTGDSRAFAEVFRRYREMLYGYCISILGDEEDAGDALQSTMIKALQVLPGESRELSVKPWLFRVAHNQCIDQIRGRKQTQNLAEHDPIAPVGVESMVATRERLRRVFTDLDHLPERQRSVLVMRELNGLSFEEIGQAIQVTDTAAKQAVYEARCALQEQAEGHAMKCESVRTQLSGNDGRVLSGRRIRAHLRSCNGCADFKTGIQSRQSDLRSLIPTVPTALALSILESFGGSIGSSGLVGLIGAGGKVAFGSGAMKAAAVVAVTAGVGAGTVGIIEVVNQGPGSANGPVEASSVIGINPRTGAVPGLGMAVGLGGQDGGRTRSDRVAGVEDAHERRSIPSDSGGKHGPAPADPVVSSPSRNPVESSGARAETPIGLGGARGRGATPNPGGPPEQLPEASAGGQAQAAEHASPNSAINRPVPPGRSSAPSGNPDAGPNVASQGNSKKSK